MPWIPVGSVRLVYAVFVSICTRTRIRVTDVTAINTSTIIGEVNIEYRCGTECRCCRSKTVNMCRKFGFISFSRTISTVISIICIYCGFCCTRYSNIEHSIMKAKSHRTEILYIRTWVWNNMACMCSCITIGIYIIYIKLSIVHINSKKLGFIIGNINISNSSFPHILIGYSIMIPIISCSCITRVCTWQGCKGGNSITVGMINLINSPYPTRSYIGMSFEICRGIRYIGFS